jgi:hypothetical protein
MEDVGNGCMKEACREIDALWMGTQLNHRKAMGLEI